MLARFLTNARGGVAPLMAVIAVPVMAAVGMAVDYSRVNAARTAFQSALDATALMVSKDATNQGLGLQLGWASLVGGGPFPVPPPKDPLYIYTDVIILLTDGLNTQNRWSTDQNTIDTRE